MAFLISRWSALWVNLSSPLSFPWQVKPISVLTSAGNGVVRSTRLCEGRVNTIRPPTCLPLGEVTEELKVESAAGALQVDLCFKMA